MDIQSEAVRADSSAHQARQLSVEESVAASGLCQADEFSNNDIVYSPIAFAAGARDGVAGVFLCDVSEGAHQVSPRSAASRVSRSS
jgi:hypothetical protein